MLYALICKDKPGHLQLRMDTRPAHVEHLNALNEKGILKIAGPFLDAAGKPTGSLVVLETDSREDAEALANADPYAKAGLFATVEVHPWNWTFNRPEGN